MNNPKISVIVPIVKAKYLEKCIRSITCQTYSNLEIICVMANSDELNSLLIEDLKNTDNRIKTIQALNSDKGSILSNGLSIANGDYIAFINPDDWLLLTLFETFVEDLNRFEDGTVVTPALLKETGLVKKQLSGIKVLGNGVLEKKLIVKANKFSTTAKESIEAKGGKVEVI